MSQAGRHHSMVRLPKTLPKQARLLVESAIERHQAAAEALIAFLDHADGDPDVEPSLGSIGSSCDSELRDQALWACGSSRDDREYDAADPPANVGIDEDELDDNREDCEPSLGALENHERQVGWANSGTDDLEATTGAFDMEAAR